MNPNLQNERMITFYKKLTIANFFNWLGVRLFNLSRRFCAQLITYAIHLDPSRKIFKRNLLSISAKGQHYQAYKNKTFPFYTIPEGCNLLSGKIKYFNTNKTIKLSLPKVINDDIKVSEKYVCEAKLPDTYLAELEDVTVFGGTDLIVVQNLALYDEIDRNEKYTYGVKPNHIISKVSKDRIIVKIPTRYQVIASAIHFTKDHSSNYFHWLVECLPRLSLINDLDTSIPLLIDSDISHQLFEALQLINLNGRKLIKLAKGEAYKVKKLYYPSQLSVVHDNYNVPCYHKDAIYSPAAINFVRESVLKSYNLLLSPKRNRKIYISRKNSDHRQLLNTTEIENILVAKGFEIIFPEHLSFYTQVQIFSEASIIIGQSGAGLANCIFAPKNCKILIIYSDVPQTNLQLFNAVIEPIGGDVKFLIGRHIPMHKKYLIHADFYIDTTIVLKYLDDNI
jgi:capsular polysaccharide biosynthesis protein